MVSLKRALWFCVASQTNDKWTLRRQISKLPKKDKITLFFIKLESTSFLFPPQHEQYYPEGLSVFAVLDKVSMEIQGLSSTDCNFQGLTRPWIFFKFQGLSKCVRTLFLSDKRGGVGDLLIEGGDYFKYFHQRGGIIRGRQLIKGQLLFKEME